MKYIPADKLIAEIEGRIKLNQMMLEKDSRPSDYGRIEEGRYILRFVERIQQEHSDGVDGVVHHALKSHWIVTDINKLAAILKAFPEGAKVELFICAKEKPNGTE